ncbi:MAG: MOSC domain-containing protein [Rhizobiales bacterium]|nr:MOSC domain-containing protein [Hyphomicrobiales bacterium]
MSEPVVAAIERYPVKGLGAQALDEVVLEANSMLPLDRVYAIENGGGRFDALAPRHLPKVNYLMLMRNERLATLETSFEEEGHVLTIRRAGRQVARGALSTSIGRQLIEQFLAAYLKSDLRGAPRIVSAEGHHFSDCESRWLHVVNLASVRDLARIAGREIDPRRFRANLYVDGIPAWQEHAWLDCGMRVGAAHMRIVARTERCEATDVDPSSGARDMSIPRLLERTFGHTDFGVYVRVAEAGRIAVGDPVSIGSSARPAARCDDAAP